MTRIHRRSFLKTALLTTAALGLPARLVAQQRSRMAGGPPAGAFIIDTNVNCGSWPFRVMKYGATTDLVAKLRKHKIKQAWTGSYEALFHKNIDGVNARLTEDCRANGGGILLPFGTVNPAFPDWEEDLRRCHEVYRMRGIRLHPVYHGYTLDDPKFGKLLDGATRRGLIVQIPVNMEDERMQHPLVDVPEVNLAPLPGVLRDLPNARVMIVHPFRHVRGAALRRLIDETGVGFEFSNLDAVGGVGRMLEGNHWNYGARIPLDRLYFGSHFPFFPLENALFKFIESPLSRAQADAMAFGNAERLLQTA